MALLGGCGQVSDSGEAGAPDGSAAMTVDASTGASADARLDSNADAIAPTNVDAIALSEVDATDVRFEAGAEATAPEPGVDATGCGAGPDAAAGGDCGAPKPVACDFFSCPTGCCDANGVCRSGVTAAACGGGGGACQTCPVGLGCVECADTICDNQRSCACTPESCPMGCCGGDLFAPTCQAGTSDTACGAAGMQCTDCTAGYATACSTCGDSRDSLAAGTCSNQKCVYPLPCPFGCLDARGVCRPGASNKQCGSGASDCVDCSASGTECIDQQCQPADDAGVCNDQTCPSGCCDANEVCRPGTASTSCGTAGIACQSCTGLGLVCSHSRCGAADGGAACGWFNCNGCCDASGNCVAKTSDTQCGALGSACADCSRLGDQCVEGACTAPDGAVACSASCDGGCCDSSGTCQLGFIDTQCGSLGAACQDCTSQTPASTCDVSASPRTCTSEQTSCPGTYSGCPAALHEQALAEHQGVCSATDLENAAVACAAGPETAYCLVFDGSQACRSCLLSFVNAASDLAIRRCAAPFVDATCSHEAACLDDCLAQACATCVIGYTEPCGTRAQSSTCAAYVQASACVTQALNGPAAVCNLAMYQGNYGAWLAAVGALYCGQ